MRIFLSYASEDCEVAKEIQLALTAAGHTVFFDRTSLPSGGDYNARIREALEDSHAMIFLLSPHSVDRRSYTLTEMHLAEKKWPHPKELVLPVVVGRIDFKTIPAYLKAVTVLEPEGNIAAEVVAAVEQTWGKRVKSRKVWNGIVVFALAGVLALTLILTPLRSFFLRLWPPSALTGDVLIASFVGSTKNTYDIANRLRDNLEAQLTKNNMDDVTVKVLSSPLDGREQAETLADEGAFKVVIWGWYDALGISLRIFLPSREVPAFDIDEVPWELADTPNEEIRMLVREVLPENTSFLSLFVIGHLCYLANDYEAGHRAYDAAMRGIPENVVLENNAVQHFFLARQKHASITADAHPKDEEIVDAVCGYVQAIKEDSTLAAAQNNLGIILSEFKLKLESDSLAPAGRCLSDAGLGSEPVDFFNEAIRLQPDLAIFKYNAIANEWNQGITKLPGQSPYRLKLEEIVRVDDSIPGPHILLGILAFDADDIDLARHHFSDALSLVSGPVSAKLHVNIGQTHLRAGDRERARESFQKTLSVVPDDGEAHLALAVLDLGNGRPDSAFAHLDAISSPAKTADRLSQAAAIFRSRVHLKAGDAASAIGILEGLDAHDRLGPGSEMVDYLLGLSYQLSGDADAAAKKLRFNNEMVSLMPDAYDDDDNTAGHAWLDLHLRCGDDPVMEWGEESDCLPSDVRARIEAVYAVFERRLSHRLYFLYHVDFGGLACPYVFTYDQSQQGWRMDTTILYKLTGRTSETAQRRRLERFDGRLLIKEIEPEISYIDQLHVLVVDETGRQIKLTPQIETLQRADERYLILKPNDEIRLHFPEFRSTVRPRQYWVVARGYYEPMDK